MCLVDAWKVWNIITVDDSGRPTETQKEFYGDLAAELIDNNYDGGRIEQQNHAQRSTNNEAPPVQVVNPRTGEIRQGVDLHLTPTKHKRMDHGVATKLRYQGCCVRCGAKTTWCCSGYEDDEEVKKICSYVNHQRPRLVGQIIYERSITIRLL
jgi:hypothetical protein